MMPRAVLAPVLALASCSALIARTPDGECVTTADPELAQEQCSSTLAVREWFATNVDGYNDDGLRTEWKAAILGFTFRPHSVVVTTDRVLCHELLHAHLWRVSDDPCSTHEPACGWDEGIETDCTRSLNAD
jgi:hypothetical protein